MHLSNDRRASRPGRQPTIAPMPDDDRSLAAALRGVRALLLDLDGVILLAGKPIPGSLIEFAMLRGVALDQSVIVGHSAADKTMAERLGISFRESAAFFGW